MDFEPIILNPPTPATSSVIWLHGLGADGNDFVDMVPQLNLPSINPIRFIFPHAPIRPVTINANMQMRAWYDIYNLEHLENEDITGIQQSQTVINQLIDSEIAAGIPSYRIVLAGFSQGGAIALYTGLRYPKPLAGIIGLSTYLPSYKKIATEKHLANQKTPIFLAHGQSDPIMPIALGQKTQELLKKLGHPVEWHDYAMQHQVCMEEIAAIRKWLIQQLH